MTQPTLFDVGPAPIEDIIEAHEWNEHDYLQGARLVLYRIAGQDGEVSTDTYWQLVEDGTIPPLPEGSSPNRLGGLFSNCEYFEPVGWMRSKRPSAHGNLIKRWRTA